MKYHLRVPTEMYAYIEAEYEGDAEGAVSAYRELTALVKVQPESELSYQAFAEICEEYLETGKLANGGDYNFNPPQKEVLKLITKIVRKRNE